MRARLRALAHDDDGSTLLLAIAYGALALALILVIAASTSLLVERRRLFSLADGAALAGAEAFALESIDLGHPGAGAGGDDDGDDAVAPSPRLADDAVDRAARAWVEAAPTELEGVEVVQATSLDDRTAEVTLASWWRPPVVTAFVPDGVRLDVTVAARAVFLG